MQPHIPQAPRKTCMTTERASDGVSPRSRFGDHGPNVGRCRTPAESTGTHSTRDSDIRAGSEPWHSRSDRGGALVRGRIGVVLLIAGLLLTGCASASSAPLKLSFLGQQQLAPGTEVDGTLVGGLSGITYDPDQQLYYIVSDDRSVKNPSRFYTARIEVSPPIGLRPVEFVSARPWRDTNGAPFGPLDTAARPAVVPPDAEGIAVDTRRQRIYWSSEGERLITDGATSATILADPWIRISDFDGGHLGAFTLPAQLEMSAEDRGPRQNLSLEGLTLTPSGRWVWAAMEGPLFEDGGPASEAQGALTRFTRFDPETGLPTGQFAYPADAVTAGPGGDNGVSDLVALTDSSFLVVERGFGTHNAVRIYQADVGDADDVLTRRDFGGPPVRPMTKSLVADLTGAGDLGRLDNIEGITLGPRLSDGRQTVLLVSDDNFSPKQITQVLAYALALAW